MEIDVKSFKIVKTNSFHISQTYKYKHFIIFIHPMTRYEKFYLTRMFIKK